MKKSTVNNLTIDEDLLNFINNEVIPGTDIDPKVFWNSFDEVVHKLVPKNRELIQRREKIQKKIDDWHLLKKGSSIDKSEYYNFLKSIQYVVDEKSDFKISTSNVDKEISSIAGPQLVVPVDNARYALNAANARWGSLYDAVYGTDVIPGKIDKGYDEERGKKVINYTREFLDNTFPINGSSWKKIDKIKIENQDLKFFVSEKSFFLKSTNQFIGYTDSNDDLSSVLLKNNNLHTDIIIDSKSTIGKNDKANISNIVLESAISTIVDNEDSVAAVDAKDKIKCYRNWLGLMKGDLEAQVEKNKKKLLENLIRTEFINLQMVLKLLCMGEHYYSTEMLVI